MEEGRRDGRKEGRTEGKDAKEKEKKGGVTEGGWKKGSRDM